MTSLIFENIFIDELPGIAKWILKFSEQEKFWIFEGEMGAGKTTFIKIICECLGVKSIVQSPTFGLVNEYKTEMGQTIYHFDFYRIKNEEEVMDMGIEEYFYSGNYCFIEWPSKIKSQLPEKYLKIKMLDAGDPRRGIIVEKL